MPTPTITLIGQNGNNRAWCETLPDGSNIYSIQGIGYSMQVMNEADALALINLINQK